MKPLILLLAVMCLALAGCGKHSDAACVREDIAREYSAYYDQGISDPEAGAQALKRALAADPANAYTVYLQAAHAAQQKSYRQALDLLEKANGMKKIVHYVGSLPPNDPQQTLNRIRQFGFTAPKAAALGSSQPAYCQALRVMGRRVAGAEPVTTLALIAGASVIRTAAGAEVGLLKKAGKAKEAAALQKKADAFGEWNKAFAREAAKSVADYVEEAGKAAGLTDSEMADYAAGKPLKNEGKQKKADSIKNSMYSREIAVIRRQIGLIPSF